MPRIKILPTDLRNKIAAGEVIERPASVVKELVENAVDAESSEIRIDVLYGGKRLIKVSDNGTGMDHEDARLCFERHATSKLLKEEDLFDIRTLGFRGEALPSIGSVSKVRLTTGLKGSPAGIAIELHGGEVKEIRDSPVSGTTIEVKDLFYNTPARQKFLKTNTTELYHIIDVITREALSHPDIGFALFTENQETLNLSKASGFRERIMQIFGDEFSKGLLEISAESEGMTLHAFVSNSDNFRNTKSHQFLFLNRRPIKDQSLSHAVYKAYEGILPHEQHPIFFVFLDLNPENVDFNVHPTKREVRFADKEIVYKFVNKTINKTIKTDRSEFARQFAEPPEQDNYKSYHSGSPGSVESTSAYHGSVVSEKLEFAYKPSLPHIYLGDTFVAVSGKGGLTIIDHHAAHERVLYEKLMKGMSSNSLQLLFPKQVRLSPKEYMVLLQNTDLIKTFGIDIDDFGQDTIIVRAIPDDLDQADLAGILSDIAAGLQQGAVSHKFLQENIAARIACHSSIRGKTVLTQEELMHLINDLDNTEHPDQCPHGRPTRIFFSLNDLNKMFKRK